MDGYEYEHNCAELLRKKGFSKVSVTKGSGDQGVDIIAYSGGKKYGIQCKYYSYPVGNHAVQEAFAGARYYNCDIAVVMTNNTFTPAAKELANKTGVLLWDNNKVLQSSNSFWITRFIGIFAIVIGVFGLTTMRWIDEIKFPILQSAELAFLVIGGFFSVFEYRNWGMSFFSCIAYFVTTFLNLVFSTALKEFLGKDFLIFVIIFLVSFFRMDYLYNQTNGYHVWKNCFRDFANDNFRKRT